MRARPALISFARAPGRRDLREAHSAPRTNPPAPAPPLSQPVRAPPGRRASRFDLRTTLPVLRRKQKMTAREWMKSASFKLQLQPGPVCNVILGPIAGIVD